MVREDPIDNTMSTKSPSNSWVKSIENSRMTKYLHYYFCKCGHLFKLNTVVNISSAPDVDCPNCGNDTFVDVDAFTRGELLEEVEDLSWGIEAFENHTLWGVHLCIDLPVCNYREEVILQRKKVLQLHMHKNGHSKSGKTYDLKHYPYITNKYNLPIHHKTGDLDLMALQTLYDFIINHKTKEIVWLKKKDIENLPVDKKVQCINYFLKHPHLKELNFYYWDMVLLQNDTRKYSSEISMLDFVCNHRKEKSVKKALYHTYKNAIAAKQYNPHSDYVFSRTIDDTNLLVKLLNIDPDSKQKIFTDDNYLEGMELVIFLKKHYSEKQICKLFSEEMLSKQALRYWEDIMRMMQRDNAFLDLERNFLKVKLTIKHLHDEIIRVLHAANFFYEENAALDYEEDQLSAQGIYDDLVFKLPFSAEELSLWSKILHNCMFGYIGAIQKGDSLIYGVFKNDTLLYALEFGGTKIVQAKAVSNQSIPHDDMKKIKQWHNEHSDISTKSQDRSSRTDPHLEYCITM